MEPPNAADNVRHHLDAVHEADIADDPVFPRDLNRRSETVGSQTEAERFAAELKRRNTTSMDLRAMKRLTENPNSTLARELLNRKIEIVPDDDLLHPSDPNVDLLPPVHHLDAITVFGSNGGFGPLITDPPINNARLTLKLTNNGKRFTDKYANPGFSLKGRTLFIGYWQGSTVYFVFAPNNRAMGEVEGDSTVMSKFRTRQFLLFLGMLLQAEDGVQVVIRRRDRVDVLDDEQWRASHNFECVSAKSHMKRCARVRPAQSFI